MARFWAFRYASPKPRLSRRGLTRVLGIWSKDIAMADWVPALTTSSLLAVALWLGKSLISTRLKRSIEFEFNAKLENLRNELKNREQELKALRDHLLLGAASSRQLIDKRRLDAVDALWGCVIDQGSSKMIAAGMAAINIEEASKIVQKNESSRQVFEVLGTGFDPKKINQIPAYKAKPYVSAMTWALYRAHASIISHAVLHWQALKLGMDSTTLVKDDAVRALIEKAAPEYKDYLAQYGSSAFFYLLEPLEDKLIIEIQRMLEGKEEDQASIRRAAEIVKASNDLQKSDITSNA